MLSIPDEEVEQLARNTLGLDEDPDESTPKTYLALFKEHVQRFPYDTHFIIELGEPARKGSTLGGNGFGVVTCMEDDCWKDVILSADPRRPEGGKPDGIGSFSDFQDHCREAAHIKGRSERCKRLGINLSPVQQPQQHSPAEASRSDISSTQSDPSFTSFSSSSPPSQLPSSSQRRLGQSHSIPGAGPSRPSPAQTQSRSRILIDLDDPLSGSLPSPSTSSSYTRRHQTSSSPVRHLWSSSTPNNQREPRYAPSSPPHSALKASSRDVKPLTTQTRTLSLNMSEPIVFSDDSGSDDDEVHALLDSEIPEEFRKVTNIDNPIILTDDSDDDEITIKPRGKGKAVARTGSSQIPLAPIFGSQRAKTVSQAGPSSNANGVDAIDMSRSESGDSIGQDGKAFDAMFSNSQSTSSQDRKGKGKAGGPTSLGVEIMSADERVKRLEAEEKAAEKRSRHSADVKPALPSGSAARAPTSATLSNENAKYYVTEEKYYNTTIIQ
ncbi:hypothetical protein I316_02830 [Kwoniella heveanensis BCC8398]|uniref:Uncharacterized protein n=1 Tax=Kwoniella heveanensis BCC8398 TaxID=1296120 RepID=A0A1B9GW72_9TREE|nr:hypothetical protein I316_02830 [Kwoniella heveanensis BCC8398]